MRALLLIVLLTAAINLRPFLPIATYDDRYTHLLLSLTFTVSFVIILLYGLPR